MMTTQIQVMTSQPSLGTVIERILATGTITRADKNYLLRAVVSETLLSHTEQHLVKRVFDRLQMGLLKVVS